MMQRLIRFARWLYWWVFSWMVQRRRLASLYRYLLRWKVKSILLTDAEVNAIIRKRCDAVSRRGLSPFDPAEQIAAVVGSERERFAELTVRSVRPVTLNEVTLDMAKAEGFSSVEGWRQNQVSLYGSASADTPMYRITFNVERLFTEKQEQEQNAG